MDFTFSIIGLVIGKNGKTTHYVVHRTYNNSIILDIKVEKDLIMVLDKASMIKTIQKLESEGKLSSCCKTPCKYNGFNIEFPNNFSVKTMNPDYFKSAKIEGLEEKINNKYHKQILKWKSEINNKMCYESIISTEKNNRIYIQVLKGLNNYYTILTGDVNFDLVKHNFSEIVTVKGIRKVEEIINNIYNRV